MQEHRRTRTTPGTEGGPAPDHARQRRRRGLPQHAVLFALIAISSGIELTLTAADLGLIGSPVWRPLAYQNGAFWAGLLDNWRPNYPAQPWLMFFTYAFLHTDIWHLTGNMLTLAFLGGLVTERSGQGGFALIYAASVLGGGAAFGLLHAGAQPMVGASGALFGLAGAWLFQEWSSRRGNGAERWPVWGMVLALAALNLLLWFTMHGQLAWETHLGGFLAGAAAAAALQWRARRRQGGKD